MIHHIDSNIDDQDYVYRVDLIDRLVSITDEFRLKLWKPSHGHPHAPYRSIHKSLSAGNSIYSISFWRNLTLAQASHNSDYAYWTARGRPALISRLNRNSDEIQHVTWIEDDWLPGQALLGYVIESEKVGEIYSHDHSILLSTLQVLNANGTWVPMSTFLSGYRLQQSNNSNTTVLDEQTTGVEPERTRLPASNGKSWWTSLMGFFIRK